MCLLNFFFLILEIDSSSSVSKLYLYSEISQKDSSYRALAELTTQDFKKWGSIKAKNKIIIIPVLSLAPSEGDYVGQVFSDFFWPDIRKKHLLLEKNKSIMTKLFIYTVPTTVY